MTAAGGGLSEADDLDDLDDEEWALIRALLPLCGPAVRITGPSATGNWKAS
ncbi:hypothetical protein OG311_00580 [Streptomyces sp. NBC_01343]|uniref:hypothetical protein n=1 Tax=Streptomyces sp. NBC_01343 TaxID=2903832 RepID=UPI002E0E56B7|nr:hypothetical protein OG311_00580 [Streptomyces sp. NBC_01343]